MRSSLRDLRWLGEATLVIVATWLVLGEGFALPISQADGSLFALPYTQSLLAAGGDWTDHLYRFGVVGGTPMHAYGGTLPIVELCGLAGLSPTAAVNVLAVFVQLCFAFFGLTIVDAVGSQRLGAADRITAIWIVAFAPALGWRLAIGHEVLIVGLVPWLAAVALVLAARAGRGSPVLLAFAAFAVWNGVSALGAQLVLYSAVFGTPLLVAFVLTSCPRWTRDLAVAIAALAAGVLFAVPRLVPMLAYAGGDDAGRTLDDAVIYELGPARSGDWASSLLWSVPAHPGVLVHDRNYPLGPLVVFLAALWPRGWSRWIAVALGGAAALAVALASDVWPFAGLVRIAVPPLDAFRVPARAILPVLACVPPLALAAWWHARDRARDAAEDHRYAGPLRWLAIAVALAIIRFGSAAGSILLEIAAWTGVVILAATARWRPQAIQRRVLAPLLAPIAAFGVLAFAARFPTGYPREPIEDGPRRLRAAVLAEAPSLAMALERVQLVDAPLPYRMSTAFAAGLSSIDGAFNPPRRFRALLGALAQTSVPPTAVVFELARHAAFPVLQQLYNIRHVVRFSPTAIAIAALPEPVGPAWLPSRVETLPDPHAIARAMWSQRDRLGATAWLLASDRIDAPARCDGRVERVTTDALGQIATIELVARTDCALVVATTYVSTLRATAQGRPLRTFPIDVALTGVAVPAGTATVVIAPALAIPWWARAAGALGVLLLGAAMVWTLRRQATQ